MIRILPIALLFWCFQTHAQHISTTKGINRDGPTTKCRYSKAAVVWESDPPCAQCEAEDRQKTADIERKNK